MENNNNKQSLSIFGYETLSLVNYPGELCSMVFTNGCNMSCWYCHNKESINTNLSSLDSMKVLDSFIANKHKVPCICISGGEPTLQPDALVIFIKKAKENGMKVKLDTNGTNSTILKYLIDNNLLDYVAMDIKTSILNYGSLGLQDSEKNIKEIYKSIDILLHSSIDYEFRLTYTKDTIDEDEILDIRSTIEGAKRFVIQKYNDSICKTIPGHGVPSNETIQTLVTMFEGYVKEILIRG